MSEKIKILIVDDSSFMRNILGRLLDKDGRFEVVGKAKDGAEGVEMVKSLHPDVVTMDIEMPRMNGIEALKLIMKDCPTPVVMVSSLTKEGATATLEAMDFGAVDFIPKAMDSGATSVLMSSGVLMDKIYAAAKVRMSRSLRQPLVAKAYPAIKPKIETAKKPLDSTPGLRKTFPRLGLPTAKLFIIGSSTGGPRALQSVIPLLPENLRVPVVVAQHMPEHFTGPMAERLNSISKVKVVEAKDGDILEAGTVYIAPGGVHTRVLKGVSSLKLSVNPDKGGECVYKPSVDILTSSATEAVGGAALAMMLTGMGSDGAKGFDKLKGNGGYILAQDEQSCIVYGMPKSVAHIADEVLPLDDMISAVIRLIG